MKIKMKIEISGNRGDGTEWPPYGGEIDVPAAEAHDLISAGHATEVKAEKKAEKVAEPDPKPEPEKADAPVETATAEEEEPEKATGLTTSNGPVKRGPGRPRKNA